MRVRRIPILKGPLGLALAIALLAIGGGMLIHQWRHASDSPYPIRPTSAPRRRHAVSQKPAPPARDATFASLPSRPGPFQEIPQRIAPPNDLPSLHLPHRWISPDRLIYSMLRGLDYAPPAQVRLTWTHHRLWISLRVDPNKPGVLRQPFFGMYEPATDSMIDLSTKTSWNNSQVNDMAAGSGQIWLATDKGVVRVQTDTLQVTRYDDKAGLPEIQTAAVAAIDGQWIAAGDNPDWSLFHPQSNTFSALALGLDTGKENQPQPSTPEARRRSFLRELAHLPPRERAKTIREFRRSQHFQSPAAGAKPHTYRYSHFIPFHDWVMFQADQVRLFNLKTHEIRLASDELAKRLGPAPTADKRWTIDTYTAGPDALWITSGSELIRFDPDQQTAGRWTLPGDGPCVVTPDGDFLWIARSGFYPAAKKGAKWNAGVELMGRPANRAESYVMLRHLPSQKWLGFFRVEGTVQSMCPSPQRLWIGMTDTDWPLLEIDTRAAFQPFGPSPATAPAPDPAQTPLPQTGATPAILAAYAGDLSFLQQRSDDELAPTPSGWTPLMAAAAGAQPDVVRWLLAHGARSAPGIVGDKTVSPLVLAAGIGDESSMRALIAAGAAPDLSLDKWQLPLTAAVDSANPAAVGLLLDKGADPLSILRDSRMNQPLVWSPLIRAARRGETAIARLILAHRSPGPWDDAGTALAAAIRHGNTQTLHALLEAGLRTKSLDEWNHAPLEWAVISGDMQILNDLLTHRADPNYAGLSSRAPLLLACALRNLSIIQRLLGAGADVNHVGEMTGTDADNAATTVLHTPFIVAATEGDGPIMQCLLDHGCDLNKKIGGIRQGDLALVTAGANRHLDVAQLLMRRGFNLKPQDHQGRTALWRAAKDERREAVAALLKLGADPNIKGPGGQTPLQIAPTKTIAALLRDHAPSAAPSATPPATSAPPADPNAKDPQGWPALVLAAAKGDADQVAALIQAKADLNAQGPGQWTALMQACKQGHTRIITLLLRAGAEPQMQNMLSRTATDIASDFHQSAALKLLEQAGAIRDDGRKLIDAAWRSRVETVNRLLHQGANVNGVDQTGRTALFYALDRQRPPHAENYSYDRDPWVAKLLVVRGADVNHVDHLGRTPLMAALTTDGDLHPSPELIELLVRHGAIVDPAAPSGRAVRHLIEQIQNPDDRRAIEKLLQSAHKPL
jgi:ankyrin repeat protein